MEYKELKKLVELVENAAITHLSIDENGTKIEIKKEIKETNSVVLPQAAVATPIAQPPIAAPVEQQEAAAKPKDKNLIEIKAQMVGTFYHSANPDSPAFVKVGDRIKKGDVICIIEAMKLFNEIESEEDGVIEEICVSNEAAVEYGQTLFLIKKG
ncbi:acetyl-CoA carboxylase biotin carboxyl carrier protein [Candidatus Marinamargulisbacteria bacterium SCGC AG-333-B06]|nr:acetyl-CoA carboxylase biotin carboxyl carrier protein [Candidatus Marinamargulisbacteria bacterium SCGC AG-333-B06]